jgi:ABC-2 type transport system permease protein
MRNIWTVARKELRGYFDHPTAYILLVVFLAINFFFYFRSVFLVSEASLRPMFDLLPWILLFFVPAVTMGSLAEEKRHGTLEVTLSHPLHEHEFLLGKFVGDVLFIAIALGGTLLVPLLLLLGGKPDFGVVFAQYFGGLLLVAGMTAVGVFASALTRNQITAFIVATAVCFILMMAGTEVVQIGLPAWLQAIVGPLGILPHFANVARGVIDLRDVVYFVALVAAFLALAYWLLLRDRLGRKGMLYKNLRLGTAAIVAIAVVANMFGGYIPGRLDLTGERLYTLSRGTRQILGDLDDLVTVSLFTSRELPAQVRPLQRDVNDVLRDFERYGRGNIVVVRLHPDRSEEARQEAQQLGVSEVQFNVVRQEELQLKNGWLGIAVQYAGGSEVIPFVGDSRNLEYQLASRVWRLTRTETPSVAFVTGHGEKSQGEYAAFTRELRRNYEVSSVDLSSDSATIDAGLDALIVAGPTRVLGSRARQLLISYMGGDGSVLYLGEGASINMQYLFASGVPDSARDVTEEYGVRVNGDLVFDLRSNESIQVPGEVFSYVLPYPFWIRALPAAPHPITRNLNSVFLPWVSSLDTLATFSDRRFTPLLVSSQYASHQTGAFQIRPDADPVFDPEELREQLLAVAVQGAVAAGAAAAAVVDVAGDGDEEGGRVVGRRVFEGPAVGRAVIVGDADFLVDQFAQEAGVRFALNALDWLTQTEALMSIRAKTPTPRALVFESNFQMLMVKFVNLVGVPLAFVLFGALRLFRRRGLSRRVYGA